MLGIDSNYIGSGTDSGLLNAIDDVIKSFEALGVRLVEINLPTSKPEELRDLWLPIVAFEAVKAHEKTFPSKADDYGSYLRSVLELGLTMNEADYVSAQMRRNQYATQFETELKKVDAIICPAGGFVFKIMKTLSMETKRKWQV